MATTATSKTSSVPVARACTAGDGDTEFLAQMESHMERFALDEACVCAERHPAATRRHAMQLIDVAMTRLLDQRHAELQLPACCRLLCAVARLANRKEALICLLEKGEMFKEDVCFRALLQPLQLVLLRATDADRAREAARRSSSLTWALNTLYAHLASVPLPADHALAGSERLLMDADPCVRRHACLLHEFAPFLKPFVAQLSLQTAARCGGDGDRAMCARTTARARHRLLCFLLKCFDRPLALLDLELAAMRGPVKSLMAQLGELQSDYTRLFALVPTSGAQNVAVASDEEESDERQVSALAAGTFLYLLLAERVTLESAPAVFCPAHLFRQSVPLCVTLLRRRESCAVDKGARLLSALLERLAPERLSVQELDAPSHADLSAALINVAVFRECAPLRAECVRLLTAYTERFELHGRYMVLLHLLNSNHNPSVRAYVVDRVRQNVAAALRHDDADQRRWFVAPCLARLIRASCRLPAGGTTDLLESHNHVMSALNLLRFLLLRDRQASDVTGVWALLDELSTDFIEPLRTALDLSRAHFRLRAVELSDGGSGVGPDRVAPPPTELTVAGQSMSCMNADQQRQTVELALTTLDLIGNVLGWVRETIGGSSIIEGSGDASE